MKPFLLLILSLTVSFTAQAGLVSHSLGSLLSIRDCPTATDEQACIIESFGDGENSTVSQISYAENSLAYSNQFSNGTLTLDLNRLSLPVFKFEVTSNAQQRNGVNLFAYQEFVWDGDAADLKFNTEFDFIMSAGSWNGGPDSRYNVTSLIAENIEPGSGFFPILENPRAEAVFRSDDATGIEADVKFESNLDLNYRVAKGESFYVSTFVQSFGINGGYVNALNTLETTLTAFDLDGNELGEEEIKASLVAQNRGVPVSAPSAFLLALVAFGFMVKRNRN